MIRSCFVISSIRLCTSVFEFHHVIENVIDFNSYMNDLQFC
jgi:hypothetical protein